uniref:Uncharacterized protein n=1 Tax=Macrostomum lignano TaxID=282301 RepID=A0A1I8FTK2_9PLAT
MSTGFSSDLMQQLAELDARSRRCTQPASASLFTTPAIWREPQLLMLNEGVNKLTILRQKLYFVKGQNHAQQPTERAGLPCQRPVHDWGRSESLTDLLRLILDQRFDLDESSATTRLSRRTAAWCPWATWSLTFQQLVDGFFGILSTESQVITLRKMKLMYQSIAQLLDKFHACISLRKLVLPVRSERRVDLKHKEAEGILSQYEPARHPPPHPVPAMMLFANFVNTTRFCHYF